MFRSFFLGLALFLPPAMVMAGAEEGEMFGYTIGEPIEGYGVEDMVFEAVGYGFIVPEDPDMSAEFDALEVSVTPVSFEVLGMRAVARFDEEHEAAADDFASRMAIALRARFGENIWVYGGPNTLTACLDIPIWQCSLQEDSATDRYMAEVGPYVIALRHFTGRSFPEPVVELSFGARPDGALAARQDDLYAEELKTAQERWLEAVGSEEADGLLKGIE